MVVRSATISGTGVTDPEKFQCSLYAIDLNCGSGSGHTFIKSVVTDNDSIPGPHPYGLHCTSMDEVPEALEEVSKYGFYASDAQAINVIGVKSNAFS